MHYQISNYEYLRLKLTEVADDDLSLPWNAYPCLEWERGRTARRGSIPGYGTLKINTSNKLAHVVAHEIAKGPIPPGYLGCHHCDNPPCFRPIHIFAGTSVENGRDMMAKGRWRGPGGVPSKVPYQRAYRTPIGPQRPHGWIFESKGSAHPASKFSDQDVLDVIELRNRGMKLRDIAEIKMVSPSSISLIVRGITWTHVSGLDPSNRIIGRYRRRIEVYPFGSAL